MFYCVYGLMSEIKNYYYYYYYYCDEVGIKYMVLTILKDITYIYVITLD